jgi:hypothetical protein
LKLESIGDLINKDICELCDEEKLINHECLTKQKPCPLFHIREDIKNYNISLTNIKNLNLKYKLKHFPDSHPDYIFPVHNNDPLSLRKIVVRYAKYFRREFGYDFVQYQDLNEDNPDKCQAFIFGKYSYYGINTIGACCFRFRKGKNSNWWALQWIWIHPYLRSQSFFKNKLFPFFRDRFGNFYIEPPYSRTMKSFIKKYYRDMEGY